MERIDAHQHFWHFDAARDSWITADMQGIARDFLPSHLLPLLKEAGVSGCVAVQASQSMSETDFLLKLAEENDFIRGVVGWIDLRDKAIEERLAAYADFPKLKGFRHILQAEDSAMVQQADFRRGISTLQQQGYTYDILIYSNQMPAIAQWVGDFEQQRFVLDHLGKPNMKGREFSPWKEHISHLAAYGHVYCKLSGLFAETENWSGWQASDFCLYMDHLLEAFGPKRILFGSDWPVSTLAASYQEVVNLVDEFLSALSPAEQQQIWASNAEDFYGL